MGLGEITQAGIIVVGFGAWCKDKILQTEKHFNVHDNQLTPFYSLQKVLVGVSMVVRGALWLNQ